MKNPSIQSFPELIERLQENIIWQQQASGTIDMKQALSVLDAYTGTDRKQYITFDETHYTRYRVDLPPQVTDFDMYLIWWDYGQMSPIHDHAENGCIFTILDGELTEKRYTRMSDADTQDECSNEFSLQYERVFPLGNTLYITDDIGYHALGNANNQMRWVSLHVYSPAKYVTQYF